MSSSFRPVLDSFSPFLSNTYCCNLSYISQTAWRNKSNSLWLLDKCERNITWQKTSLSLDIYFKVKGALKHLTKYYGLSFISGKYSKTYLTTECNLCYHVTYFFVPHAEAQSYVFPFLFL